jgi:hypothetical protein
MPRTTTLHAVTAIGIDMGKNTLHLIGLDARGAIVLREKVARGMRKKKPTAEKLRSWRASLMRSRNKPLGIVYARDEKSAEAEAIAEFKIGEEQRRRLVVRPNDD